MRQAVELAFFRIPPSVAPATYPVTTALTGDSLRVASPPPNESILPSCGFLSALSLRLDPSLILWLALWRVSVCGAATNE